MKYFGIHVKYAISKIQTKRVKKFPNFTGVRCFNSSDSYKLKFFDYSNRKMLMVKNYVWSVRTYLI